MNPPPFDNPTALAEHPLDNVDSDRSRQPKTASLADPAGCPVAGTDPAVLARYRRPGRLFNPEFRVGLLGDLAGRRLLDVQCGTGNYSVLFAELGAQVTGLDANSSDIETARRRAAAAGVAERCQLVCGPLDATSLPNGTFDIVWTDSLLHQHICQLPQLARQLVAWTRPGGLVVFSEPVNFAPWLRRLRNFLPVASHGQPDERPLESAEVAVLRELLPDLRIEPFHLTSRLHRFVLTDHSYEKSSAPRRWAAWSMSLFDAMAFRLPGVTSLAGTAAIYGHRP